MNIATNPPQFGFSPTQVGGMQRPGGNDPATNTMAMMSMCLQCMTLMLQQIMAMSMGNQGLPGTAGFGGQPGTSPGVGNFLGGGFTPSTAPTAINGAPSGGGTGGGTPAGVPMSGATGDAQTTQGPEWASKLPGPLRNLGPIFEKYGKQYNVDPRFLAAISMLETGSGTSKAFRNQNNAMGVSDSKGPISFGNVEQSIERMARVLASSTGPYKGARTINEIGGIYAPVGAGNDVNGTNGHWPKGVAKFYQQLGGDPSQPVK